LTPQLELKKIIFKINLLNKTSRVMIIPTIYPVDKNIH